MNLALNFGAGMQRIGVLPIDSSFDRHIAPPSVPRLEQYKTSVRKVRERYLSDISLLV